MGRQRRNKTQIGWAGLLEEDKPESGVREGPASRGLDGLPSAGSSPPVSGFGGDAERTVMESLPAALRDQLQSDPEQWDEPTDPGAAPLRVPARPLPSTRPPAPKLRLPKPGEMPQAPAAKLTGPGPVTPSAPLSGPAGISDFDAPAPPAFSAEGLMSKLDKPKKETPQTATIWTKEVIITASVCAALLLGALVYNYYADFTAQEEVLNAELQTRGKQPNLVGRDPKPPQKPGPKRILPPPNSGSPTPTLRTKPRQPNSVVPTSPPPPDSDPQKTKTPMLTIVSTPPGALVEINGTVYKRTPLIMPSPSQMRSLSIRLKKDGFKKWEQTIKPNEAGHFSVNVKLESLRR